MERLAMLRQVIGQLQELLHLYDPLTLPYYLQSHPQPHEQQHRYGFLSLDDSSVEDGYYNLVMKSGGKSNHLNMLEPYNHHHPPPPATKKPRKDRNHHHRGSTEIMEQLIWKEFPEDLFEAVIAKLPTATFFRFRSVCQKWNSILTTSHSFSQKVLPQTKPWFYTITHESVSSGAMYDPSNKKWHHPTFPSFPPKTIVLPVASAGGLVCFLDIGHRNFYVCNPLTRSFKELPARSVKVWSRIAVGMTSIPNRGYKILWLGCDGEYEIYDSVKNSWARLGNMPSNIRVPLSLNFRSQTVLSNGSLYFMRSEPEGIVSYDMGSGIWKQYMIPTPMHLTDHTLAECEGKIMLVGLLTKNAATCVCIWELQKMTLLWKEVDRMPNIWCLEFYGKHVRMTCLGNKGLIMLSLRCRQMNRLVTYNVMSKEWVKVPKSVLPRRQLMACGTAFHPCPTAVA